ncbi:hypothetical protein QYE76_061218 [Lolium multiflorum]|uniref:Uncharacterized protein n=1 Tax=Lolium multiflorum TaxID=4521 RepID=A0AAD8W512_LOLMU|nr:hypothetical protein QYE76_061218 [Lolium multiflorum]
MAAGTWLSSSPCRPPVREEEKRKTMTPSSSLSTAERYSAVLGCAGLRLRAACWAGLLGLLLGYVGQLTRSNFLFWKTLVFPAIRGAMVMGLLDGTDRAPAKLISSKDADGKDITITNPAYAAWMARDQAVVSYLLQSLSPEL